MIYFVRILPEILVGLLATLLFHFVVVVSIKCWMAKNYPAKPVNSLDVRIILAFVYLAVFFLSFGLALVAIAK